MRSAMHAASQLPEKGPTDVNDPLHLHVNQKSDYDDDDLNLYFFCLFQMVTGLVVLFVAKQIKLVDFPGFSPDIFRRVGQLF